MNRKRQIYFIILTMATLLVLYSCGDDSTTPSQQCYDDRKTEYPTQVLFHLTET